MEFLIQYAMQFVGTPYKWGGESILEGYDCSGFVQEILRAAGMDPPQDQTAQGLYNHFQNSASHNSWSAGSLAFFGTSVTEIKHVGFCINCYQMLEAAGGGPLTQSAHDAVRDRAFIRMRTIKYRNDLVSILKPRYSTIGLM